MNQKFYKYQGAGNDFVLMDGRDNSLKLTPELISTLCNRHFAIGADGFMLLENDPGSEFYMRYFNADGGEVNMCGNGGRCIALFAHHLGIGGALKTFNSLDGLHTAEILETSGAGARVRLRMMEVNGYQVKGDYLSINTGVPHYVEFVRDVDAVDVVTRGRQIRNSEPFSSQGGTNVNFVQLLPDGTISIRTYERGVEDETLACGTGATACALATHILCNPNQKQFTVHVRGGVLMVSFEKIDSQSFSQVYLEGPALKVFECELNLDELIGR